MPLGFPKWETNFLFHVWLDLSQTFTALMGIFFFKWCQCLGNLSDGIFFQKFCLVKSKLIRNDSLKSTPAGWKRIFKYLSALAFNVWFRENIHIWGYDPHTCTTRLGGGMFPGRELKFTPIPPSWWAASLGSSSSSRDIRDKVPVMVAGLQVFTSLKMTEGTQ